jgi:nucleotide-binding universal stress UspA family protein
MRALKVLVVPGTTSARAEALAKYAKRGKFELILTSHHVPRGLKRAFIGSFSDSLSLVSETPLLIVPPGAKTLSEKPTILFPTDFSGASRTAFESALRIARLSRAKLTIYHKLETLVPYPFEFGSAYSPEVRRALVDEAKFSLAEMKSRAKAAGVDARVVLDQHSGHVGAAISAEAGANYGLVALGAHKGFWDRLILGSTSRFVLRECPTSVWLIRPNGRVRKTDRRAPRRNGARSPTNPENYLV